MATKEFPGSNVTDYGNGTNPLTETLTEMDQENSLLRRTMNAAGIYNKQDMRFNDTFYRTKRIDPYFFVEGGNEMLFFVKPDLNILKDSNTLANGVGIYTPYGGTAKKVAASAGVANDPYFNYLMENGYYDTVLANLTYQGDTKNIRPFVMMLSNRKTSNMDVPDIMVEEMETAQNLYGTRILYPKSSMKSDEDAEFSIEFEDDQYLDIYHYFKAYNRYRDLKWEGLVNPRTEYIENKVLHDHMGIFKFILDTDGETILYWAYATGVYPKSISRSSFNEIQDKGSLKITVSFKLSGWFTDMDPITLIHFNMLMQRQLGGKPSTNNVADIYDEEIGAVSGEALKGFYTAPGNIDSNGRRRWVMVGIKE